MTSSRGCWPKGDDDLSILKMGQCYFKTTVIVGHCWWESPDRWKSKGCSIPPTSIGMGTTLKRSMWCWEHRSRKPAVFVPAVPKEEWKKAGNGRPRWVCSRPPGERNITQVRTFYHPRWLWMWKVTTWWKKGQNQSKIWFSPEKADAASLLSKNQRKGGKIGEGGEFGFGRFVAADLPPTQEEIWNGCTPGRCARIQRGPFQNPGVQRL